MSSRHAGTSSPSSSSSSSNSGSDQKSKQSMSKERAPDQQVHRVARPRSNNNYENNENEQQQLQQENSSDRANHIDLTDSKSSLSSSSCPIHHKNPIKRKKSIPANVTGHVIDTLAPNSGNLNSSTSNELDQAASDRTTRLVFGLSPRTNKLRHKEYAQKRQVQEAAEQPPAPNVQRVELVELIIKDPIKSRARPIELSGLPPIEPEVAEQPQSEKMVSNSRKLSVGDTKESSSSDSKLANKNKTSETNQETGSADKKQPEAGNDTKKSSSESQSVAPVRKMQFTIPPPPPSKISSNKNSLVSYAKSRIYDNQNKQSNEQKRDDKMSLLGCLASNQDLTSSVKAGFKPPKQVNVSKAREKWEGGEPFAKCKSRQRLAATQSGKRLQLHGSWSMSSVVATQQMQFQQQALAQATGRPNLGSNSSLNSQSSDEPPVKILTRGSVLERVQKYERAPSVGDLAEASLTLDCSLGKQEPETGSPKLESCFVESPVKGLTTNEYLDSLNRCRKSIEDTKSPTNGSAPSLEQARRLSLRRRSSQQQIVNSVASNIPRFYHPNGKPNTYEIELQRRQIVACFELFPDRKASLTPPNYKKHFLSIALACGFSGYFKEPLYLYVRHMEPSWSKLNSIGSSKSGRLSKQASLDRANSFQSSPSSSRKSSSSGLGAGQVSMSNHVPSTIKSTMSNAMAASKKSTLTRSASITAPDPLAGNGRGNAETDAGSARNLTHISCDQYFVCWKLIIDSAYDNVARFIHLLTFGQRNYLLPDDFVPLIQSIIDDHPGLRFLGTAPDFHMRYIQTVIARIYFDINKSWTGKISQSELRQSNFLEVLAKLAATEDINEITQYFSYEHFYVIYCKFWNLDQDHDLLISKDDLARHNDASISSRIIDRIFMGIVSRQIQETNKMGYSDFVWFLMAEEDKKHTRSIEYWFRLMDIDGDGYISIYEMEYFYYEQMKRLQLMNIEALPFVDCACQMLDLVNPRESNRISLADLKRTKMVTIFFDTFINLEKYLEHESREFVSTRDLIIDGKVISDWDRYASQEYENLITEETTV